MSYNYLDPFIEKANAEFCGIIEPKHIFNTKTEFKQAIKNNLKEQRKYLTYKGTTKIQTTREPKARQIHTKHNTHTQ